MTISNSLDPVDLGLLPRFRSLPGSGTAGFATIIGTGLVCFLSQWGAAALGVAPAGISMVWIPGGLMLAILLLSELPHWPALGAAAATGTALQFLSLGMVSVPGALLVGLGTGGQTLAVAAVLRRVLRGPFTATTLRECQTYTLVVLGAGLLAGSLLVVIDRVTSVGPTTFLTWRTFGLSTVLGYLTVTPTVILLVQEVQHLRQVRLRRWMEAGLLAVLLSLVCSRLFAGATLRPVTWIAIALPPLLLWAAVGFGRLGASASLLLVSVISTFSATRGWGPVTLESPTANALSLQLFILAMGLPLLALAIALNEQKQVRAALQSGQIRLKGLHRRLIVAREEEAIRIGRELHDGVGQRLALVSIGLNRLRQACSGAVQGSAPDIRQLQEQMSSIAQTVQAISHQVQPEVLEDGGLYGALQRRCEEVHQATGMTLQLVSRGDLDSIPRDVTLCLLRVAQESLSNAMRHSGARRVDLSLRREGSNLLLQVTDDGKGFSPGRLEHPGLGFYSAAERVESVGGTLGIESAPGAGTTLRVAVPLCE